MLAVVGEEATDDGRQWLEALVAGFASGLTTEQLQARVPAPALRDPRSTTARFLRRLGELEAREEAVAAALSHDVRAPVRGLAHLVRWLRSELEGSAGDAVNARLDQMDARARLLGRMVTDLVGYMRAERDRQAPQAIDLTGLVRQVWADLRPSSSARLELGDLPNLVAPEPTVRTVVHHLLRNAIQHGAAERVPVRVEGRTAGGDVELVVRDGGPGIPPHMHDRAWTLLQTLQPREEATGTGIGLPLVRRLVLAEGGEVWLDSEEGRGATFGIRWPQARGEP